LKAKQLKNFCLKKNLDLSANVRTLVSCLRRTLNSFFVLAYPYEGKTFFITEAYEKEKKGEENGQHNTSLLIRWGKGTIVNNRESATVVLVSQKEKWR